VQEGLHAVHDAVHEEEKVADNLANQCQQVRPSGCTLASACPALLPCCLFLAQVNVHVLGQMGQEALMTICPLGHVAPHVAPELERQAARIAYPEALLVVEASAEVAPEAVPAAAHEASWCPLHSPPLCVAYRLLASLLAVPALRLQVDEAVRLVEELQEAEASLEGGAPQLRRLDRYLVRFQWGQEVPCCMQGHQLQLPGFLYWAVEVGAALEVADHAMSPFASSQGLLVSAQHQQALLLEIPKQHQIPHDPPHQKTLFDLPKTLHFC